MIRAELLAVLLIAGILTVGCCGIITQDDIDDIKESVKDEIKEGIEGTFEEPEGEEDEERPQNEAELKSAVVEVVNDYVSTPGSAWRPEEAGIYSLQAEERNETITIMLVDLERARDQTTGELLIENSASMSEEEILETISEQSSGCDIAEVDGKLICASHYEINPGDEHHAVDFVCLNTYILYTDSAYDMNSKYMSDLIALCN